MCRGPPGEIVAAALDQHFFDVGDRLSGIQPLGAGPRAIENGVASVEPEQVFEPVEPLACGLVAGVDEPPFCPGEHGGPSTCPHHA